MHSSNILDTDKIKEKTKQLLNRDTLIGEVKGNKGKFQKNAKKYKGETRNTMETATWNLEV